MNHRHDLQQDDAGELYEFFNGFDSTESLTLLSAEDIIFCGKPLPYKTTLPPPTPFTLTLDELPRSHVASNVYSRINKTHKPSLSQSTDRISSRKQDAPSGRPSKAKPKWPLLMFGLLKAPAEMELRDIRSRQKRMIRSSTFPAFETKESWSPLLRGLSCKGGADGVIAAYHP